MPPYGPYGPKGFEFIVPFVHGRGSGLIESEGVSLTMHSSLWS